MVKFVSFWSVSFNWIDLGLASKFVCCEGLPISDEISWNTYCMVCVGIYNYLQMRTYQGNLKGESVVAAILSSSMEASYCTSGFFVAKSANQFRLAWVAFPTWT